MAERTIETAEGAINVDGISSVHASITGALKSASSNNNERIKRASAVRFADQVQKGQDADMARLEASQETDEDVLRQSLQESAGGGSSPMKK